MEKEHELSSYPPTSDESPASPKSKSLSNLNDSPKSDAGKNSDRKSKAGRASPAGGGFMLCRTPDGMGRREREGEGRYLAGEPITVEERERALFVYSGLLFVPQIKVLRGGFICATNKILQVHK